MTSTAAKQRYSFAEYVELESISPVRHEFLGGHVWAMTGGSPDHAAIADPRGHTVTNPVLVVEVLSPLTEDYDRGEKLAAFKRIASLREVVLVAHDERRLEIWRRVGAIWTTEVVRGDAVARLESVPCELPLGEVYEGAAV